MKKNRIIRQLPKFFLLILSLLFLAGCATQEQNVKLHESFWQNPKHRIAVAKIKPTNSPSLQKNGDQGGLLFIAANAIATSEFNSYLKKASLDWYNDLPQKFVDQINNRNIFARKHPVDIEIKQKENANFADDDKILFLELKHLGAIRHYSSGIPMGDPSADCVLKGELVDQRNKKILWRYTVQSNAIVHGAWDQPPLYPNFTKALKKAIALAQEEIIDAFFSGH